MKYLKACLTDNEMQRLTNKITIDYSTGCWNWTGAKIKNRGYGAFNFRGRTEMVHRLMYSHYKEPVPTGVGGTIPVIDHIVCSNRACCNPAHMTLTSQRSNALRGDSPPSLNKRKTHCIRGHELPKEPNEKWGKNRAGRRCVICRRITTNARSLKKRTS